MATNEVAVTLTGMQASAHKLAESMELNAKTASAYAEALVQDTASIANMLAYIRQCVTQGKDGLSVRDVNALAYLAQCEDVLEEMSYMRPSTDEYHIALDTLKGKLALMSAHVPTTVYAEVGKREKSELHSLAMRGLRSITSRVGRLPASYVPQDLRGKLADAQKAADERAAKRAARIALERDTATQKAIAGQ